MKPPLLERIDSSRFTSLTLEEQARGIGGTGPNHPTSSPTSTLTGPTYLGGPLDISQDARID
jgi:hypothetical protein